MDQDSKYDNIYGIDYKEIERELEKVNLTLKDIGLDPDDDGFYEKINNIDFFREARDDFINDKFESVDTFSLVSLNISFDMARTKNSLYIYNITEKLPADLYYIDGSKVSINITDENNIIEYIQEIFDILNLIKKWKSTIIKINNTTVDVLGTRYVINYIFDKFDKEEPNFSSSIDDIKSRYRPKKVKQVSDSDIMDKIKLSAEDSISSINKVFDKYISIYCKNYNYIKKEAPNHSILLIIEDNVVIAFYYIDSPIYNEYKKTYSAHGEIIVQELTPNKMFIFNATQFRRSFICNNCHVEYLRFKGIAYNNIYNSQFNYYNNLFPEIELQKRYDEYSGERYHFLVFEIYDSNGMIHYGIGSTKIQVHNYFSNVCKELEKKQINSLRVHGCSMLPYDMNKQFITAFLSWRGKSKKWRLETQLKYYYIDYDIKEENEIYSLYNSILEKAENNEYDDLDRGTYTKPLNRWKSEELVYNITKKLYGEFNVIYQHRPHYLATKSGILSYDVYICGLKIAIEYQGKQHYEPVECFGGYENYLKQNERDKIKAEKSRQNGVKLIYINYWEDITPTLIKDKVEEALKQ